MYWSGKYGQIERFGWYKVISSSSLPKDTFRGREKGSYPGLAPMCDMA